MKMAKRIFNNPLSAPPVSIDCIITKQIIPRRNDFAGLNSLSTHAEIEGEWLDFKTVSLERIVLYVHGGIVFI
jgi:hypothetical protein